MSQSPSTPEPSSATAESSLLRISRRHSLPASGPLSGLFGFWGPNDNGNGPSPEREPRPAASERANTIPRTVPQPPDGRAAAHMRSSSAVVNGSGTGTGGLGGNRHRYGHHRHTRSEVLPTQQPVVVKSYKPGPASPKKDVFDEEDPAKYPLPSIDDFSFDGILRAVKPQVDQALDSVSILCVRFQNSVKTEVDLLASAQSEIDAKAKETDALTTQAFKTTKSRTERLDNENSALKNGTAVDEVANVSERTHTTMTSIISTLLAIDEMLPPQDRLSPDTSAHRSHYPRLHRLLADKATELNVCFNSGKIATRPGIGEIVLNKPTTDRPTTPVWMRRKLSTQASSSAMTGESSSAAVISSPPPLQLKSILPMSATGSPQLEANQGSGFFIPPQTATSVSFANLSAAPSTELPSGSPETQPLTRRPSLWGRRRSSTTMAFFNEPEGANATTASNFAQPSTTALSSKRSSGSWSLLGGWFGRRGSKATSESERASERLRRVLEERNGKGKSPAVVR